MPPWRRERQLLRPSGPSGGGAFSSRPTQVHSSQKFSRRRREPTVSSLLLRPGASARLSHPPIGRVGGRPISCSAAQGSVRRSGCWRWVLGCALPRRLVAEADGGREQDAPPPPIAWAPRLFPIHPPDSGKVWRAVCVAGRGAFASLSPGSLHGVGGAPPPPFLYPSRGLGEGTLGVRCARLVACGPF